MKNATNAQIDALQDVNRRQRDINDMNLNTMRALMDRKWVTMKDGVANYTGSQVYAITNAGRKAAGIEIPPPTPAEKLANKISYESYALQRAAWDLDSANTDVARAVASDLDDLKRVQRQLADNQNLYTHNLRTGEAVAKRAVAVTSLRDKLHAWDHDVAVLAAQSDSELKSWMKTYGAAYKSLHVGYKAN